MPTPPPLDAERRRQAYDASLALRRRRAEIKRTLSEDAEPLSLLAAYWQSSTDTQGMKVNDLLRALPGVGPKLARTIMLAAGIPPEQVDKKTVRSTGPKQTEALFRALRMRF